MNYMVSNEGKINLLKNTSKTIEPQVMFTAECIVHTMAYCASLDITGKQTKDERFHLGFWKAP